MPLLIVLIAAFCIFLYYVYYKYKRSNYKHVFFKTTVYRPLFWGIGILLVIPILINLLFPDTHIPLSSFKRVFIDKKVQNELLMQGNIIAYYQNIVKVIWQNINIAGFISASLIMATWFIFINRIDIFKKENFKYPILVVILGMFFSILTFLIQDILLLKFSFSLKGNILHDLFVTTFLGIGVVEEFVKLIPFFLILKFTREVDEPFDYILYACMSALGFAFIENLGYFSLLDGNVIPGRAFMSVVGHMIFSSFCVYGLVLAKFNYQKPSSRYFLISFFSGAMLHALYNYFIFSHSPILHFVFFIFILQSWAIIINNAINNSNFFDFKIVFQAQKLRLFLSIMLSSILTITYLIHALESGKEAANNYFFASCLFGGFFLIFYVTSLSNYDLVKGYWRPITIRFSAPNVNQLPGNRGTGSLLSIFKYNYIIPVNLVNYRINMKPPHYNNLLHGIMDEVAGEIIDRICLYTYDKQTGKEFIETDWFLVKLKQELLIQPYLETKCIGTHILLKLEDKTDSLVHDTDLRCFLRLIPGLNQLQDLKPEKENFAFAGFMLINIAEVPAHAF